MIGTTASAPATNPALDTKIPTRPTRPGEPLWENFPLKLTTLRQWVCWVYLFIAGRWTKVPYQPDGTKASVTTPNTWASFEHVQCAYFSVQEGDVPFDGIGFVVNAADPFTV